MLLHSFRFKLAAIILFITLLIFSIFSVIVYSLLSKNATTAFDSRIGAVAELPYLFVKNHRPGWQFIEQRFENSYVNNLTDEHVFVVQHKEYDITYLSQSWPEGTDIIQMFDSLLPSDETPLTFQDTMQYGLDENVWPSRSELPPSPRRSQEKPVGKPGGLLNLPSLAEDFEIMGYETRFLGGREFRFVHVETQEEVFILGVSTQPLVADKEAIRNTFFAMLPGLIILSLISSWIISGAAIRPINKLADEIESVSEEKLNQQIPLVSNDQEFVRLVSDFNKMLHRLNEGFTRIHRYNANAAHELKTPLMILSTQIDQAVSEEEDGSDRQMFLVELLDEIDRLTTIIERLLLLSKAESGKLSLMRIRLNFSRELDRLLEDFRETTEGFEIRDNIQQHVYVNAEIQLLLQTVDNLLTNAVKYNDERKRITIVLDKVEGYARLQVSNTGKLVPPDEAKHFFEHFYRAEKGVINKIEGHGLGLPLAKEIARAHKGDLRFLKSTEEKTTFELKIELAE